MAEMCRAAVIRGIPEIGFAEHFDLHPDDPTRNWFRLEPWAEELDRCRSGFSGTLIIRGGIELGEPHLFPIDMRQLLERYPFDFVLGSLHYFGEEFAFERRSFQRPAEEVFTLYFRELEHMAAVGGFDILAHLDVPVRTAVEVYGTYEAEQYERLIRPVLAACIRNSIAVEINTAGLRRAARILTPGLNILRWYAEMGGTLVTLGSDAHCPEDVGADLDTALETLREAGLNEVTMFERRTARQQDISC